MAELWIQTPHKRFLCSVPYMRGAFAAQAARPAQNPYRPGPSLAHYNYGYANEVAGHHDELDLPFEIMQSTDDSYEFFRVTTKLKVTT